MIKWLLEMRRIKLIIFKFKSNNDGNSDDNNNKIVQPSNKVRKIELCGIERKQLKLF